VSDFYDERERIGELLETVLRQYLADAAVPPVSDTFEYVMGQHAIGKYPSTREMRFFLEDLAAFTPELANRLRRRVLARFKSWSVVPQYAEMTFTVYADGVRFRRRKISEPITETTKDYQSWLQAAREYDEGRKGEDHRQYRHVVPLITDAVATVRRQRHAVLACVQLPDAPERKEDSVVWLLTEGGEEPPRLAPGMTFKKHTVTAAGAVEPGFCQRYWPATDVPSPYFLLAHLFAWRNRSRLKILFKPTPGAEADQRRVEVAARISPPMQVG
jgi:hypothetical protein